MVVLQTQDELMQYGGIVEVEVECEPGYRVMAGAFQGLQAM